MAREYKTQTFSKNKNNNDFGTTVARKISSEIVCENTAATSQRYNIYYYYFNGSHSSRRRCVPSKELENQKKKKPLLFFKRKFHISNIIYILCHDVCYLISTEIGIDLGHLTRRKSELK